MRTLFIRNAICDYSSDYLWGLLIDFCTVNAFIIIIVSSKRPESYNNNTFKTGKLH